MPISNRLRASVPSLEWSPISLLLAALVAVQLTVLYGTIGGDPSDVALSVAAVYVAGMLLVGLLAGVARSNSFLFTLFAGWSVFAWLAYAFDPSVTVGALIGTVTVGCSFYYAIKYRYDGDFSLLEAVR